jgi:hypothetical protein
MNQEPESLRELAKKTAKSIVDHGSIPMATLKESIILQEKVDTLLSKEIEFPEVEPYPEIPEVDLTPISDKLDELLTETKKKDLLEYDLQIDEKTRKKLKGDSGKDGKNGKDGLDGKDGIDGTNGLDGKDGSPDTPTQIVEKLESLKDDARLDAKAIKGLKKLIDNSRPVETRGVGQVIREIVAGTNVTIDNSNPSYPIVSATGGGTGSATFIGLTDVPATYTGQATKAVRVNAGETALEFFSISAGGGDVVGPASAVDSNFASYNTTTGKLIKDSGSKASDFATSTQGTKADNAVVANTAITGATKTKITYDAKGLVIVGADATTADIADSLNKRYVTDSNLTVIGNTSGTNSGDNAINTLYSGLVSNATHTGDATGATALVVKGINNVLLSTLATGILKNTTTTGVPSIATGADLPTMTATIGGAVPTPPNNTTTFLRGDGTFAAPAGSGDMVLASAQTNSGAKTFLDATLLLRNVANTVSSKFTNTATVARTWTMKDADGTVAFTSDITGTNSGTNTGDVSLAGTPNYITIAGQVITRALIDLTTHVTGLLPFANIASVATSTVMYRKTAGAGAMEAQTLATLKTDLALTGTNSGDQTSIVGITGTIAQFNTAITDGDLATGGGTATGTNTGDNAVNTLYSGLATSKQDTITLTTTGTSGAATLIGATLNIPQYSGGGGGTTITTQDEGSTLSTTVTTLNFTGAGVTASGSGATTTIDIPGGGAGGGLGMGSVLAASMGYNMA